MTVSGLVLATQEPGSVAGQTTRFPRVDWEPHPTGAGHTVVGDVRVLRGLEAPQLDDVRDLYAYLPPSHGGGRRYPVLLMQDGRNLFDEATSHAGEWRVDETMEELAREGIEAIVVGVPHGLDRNREYAGDRADTYLSFLADTVVPLVEESFDADPRPGRGASRARRSAP